MTGEELKAIAAQLRQPQGDKGIEVADMMNESNIGMTHHAIDRLDLLDDKHVLELGHGNCSHLPYLMKQKNNLRYCGLETSELMHREAQRVNQALVEAGQAAFYLYNGQTIPFADHSFDRIFTVNTIYFWTDPPALLLELYRITKPGGMLNITFAQRKFMQQLPFAQYGFELYDNSRIAQLAGTTSFEIADSDTRTETVQSKTGDKVEREFTTVSLKKSK